MTKGKYRLTRKDVMIKAVMDCRTEMYAKAQPPLDYPDALRRIENGEQLDTNLDPLYERHYLSNEEFEYILDKYLTAYNMKRYWKDCVEVVERYLEEGGPTNRRGGKYGLGVEKNPKLMDLIGPENAWQTLLIIKDCKDFYRFDREQEEFERSITWYSCPTSNKKRVIQYWKEHGKDITIEDRDPDTFWYRDEYGDDWEECYKEDKEEEERCFKEYQENMLLNEG